MGDSIDRDLLEQSSGNDVVLKMAPMEEGGESENNVGISEANEEAEFENIEVPFLLDEGDIYVYESGSLALNILSISKPTGLGKFYRVRLMSTAYEPIDMSEKELIDYINENGLVRLGTFRDQMEAIANKLLLSVGDVYTKNGAFFMEILSGELLFVDPLGKQTYVIGVTMSDGLSSYRDALWVKNMVYGNTDQFPPQTLGNE
jgi:hypothetical protein